MSWFQWMLVVYYVYNSVVLAYWGFQYGFKMIEITFVAWAFQSAIWALFVYGVVNHW
jgi:hypothetical protein